MLIQPGGGPIGVIEMSRVRPASGAVATNRTSRGGRRPRNTRGERTGSAPECTRSPTDSRVEPRDQVRGAETTEAVISPARSRCVGPNFSSDKQLPQYIQYLTSRPLPPRAILCPEVRTGSASPQGVADSSQRSLKTESLWRLPTPSTRSRHPCIFIRRGGPALRGEALARGNPGTKGAIRRRVPRCN